MIKEQWGNIELPGLSDEELLNKNWNVVAENKERLKDPEYKKRLSASMKKVKETEEYKKAFSKAMKKRTKSTDWREKTKAAAEKRSAKPEYQAKLKEALRKANSIPIVTPEGQFEVISDACRYYFDNKLTKRSTLSSVEKWMRVLLKKPDSGFYYVK